MSTSIHYCSCSQSQGPQRDFLSSNIIYTSNTHQEESNNNPLSLYLPKYKSLNQCYNTHTEKVL